MKKKAFTYLIIVLLYCLVWFICIFLSNMTGFFIKLLSGIIGIYIIFSIKKPTISKKLPFIILIALCSCLIFVSPEYTKYYIFQNIYQKSAENIIKDIDNALNNSPDHYTFDEQHQPYDLNFPYFLLSADNGRAYYNANGKNIAVSFPYELSFFQDMTYLPGGLENYNLSDYDDLTLIKNDWYSIKWY